MTCCCQLAGTAACYSCPSYQNIMGGSGGSGIKNTKVIEEFDTNGKLIKRTTEYINPTQATKVEYLVENINIT